MRTERESTRTMISSLLSSLAEAKQRTTAHVQHCWDSVGVVTICTRFEDDGCVASRRRKHQAEQHVHHFFISFCRRAQQAAPCQYQASVVVQIKVLFII